MPSSDRHIIRGATAASEATAASGAACAVGTPGVAAPPDAAETPAAAATFAAPARPGLPPRAGAPGAAATILHGRTRPGLHRPAPSGYPAGATAPGASIAVDEATVQAELRRLERAAEERGYEAGRRRAEAELAGAIDSAATLGARLEAIAPERTSQVAHAIAELALSVARRIVQHEVAIEPGLLCTSLEAAIGTINGSPEVRVMLNPASVDPVRVAWESQHGRAYLGKRWVFEGDANLPPGGCTVRFEHGFVDAGLEAQLEEIGIALDRAIPGLARGTVEEEVA